MKIVVAAMLMAASASAAVIHIEGPLMAVVTNGPCNLTTTNSIIIDDDGPAIPYRTLICVSGISNSVTKVTVTITNLVHNFPTDMQWVLVSPNDLAVKLIGKVGGASPISTTVTFDSDAAGYVPDGFAAGTYKPTDTDPGYVFPLVLGVQPPPGPYSTNLNTFAGMASGDANGLWEVYVMDDTALDGGSADSVTLTITQ